MKGKQLRKAVLLGMAMSMAVWTTGMAEEIGVITGAGQVNSPYDTSVEMTNDDPRQAAIQVTDQQFSIETTNGVHDITIESAGSGIRTENGESDIELKSSGDNIIHFDNSAESDGDGITVEDNSKVTLHAENGMNEISSQIKQDGVGDGVRIEGNGQVEVNGRYNTISVGDDGLYIHEISNANSKIEITATSADANGVGNTINGKNGIHTDGAGMVNVISNGGKNVIHGTQNAVYASGSGTITISAVAPDSEGISLLANYDEYNNELTGDVNGVWSDGTGITNVIADNDNIIAGTETGILSNDTGMIYVTAGHDNIIGQYKDEDENIVTSKNGIEVTNGTVKLAADNDNIVNANIYGVYADGANSLVTLDGTVNKIVVNKTTGKVELATGIKVSNGASVKIQDELDDSITNKEVAIDVDSSVGYAHGIELSEDSEVYIEGGTITIDVNSAHIDTSSGGSTPSPSPSPVGDGAVAGIIGEKDDEEYSTVQLKADDGIYIHTLTSGLNAQGIASFSNDSFSLETINGDIDISATSKNEGKQIGGDIYAVNADKGSVSLSSGNDIILNSQNNSVANTNGTYSGYTAAVHVANGGQAVFDADRAFVAGAASESLDRGMVYGTWSENGSMLSITTHGKNVDGIGISLYAEGDSAVAIQSQSGNTTFVADEGNIIARAIGHKYSYTYGGYAYEAITSLNAKDGDIKLSAVDNDGGYAYGIFASSAEKTEFNLNSNNNSVYGTTQGINVAGNNTTILLNAKKLNDIESQGTALYNSFGTATFDAEMNKFIGVTGKGINSQNAGKIKLMAKNSNNIQAGTDGIYSQNAGEIKLIAKNSNNIQAGTDGIRTFDSDITLKSDNGDNIIFAKDNGIYAMTWFEQSYDHNSVNLLGVNNHITSENTGIYTGGQNTGETTIVNLNATTDNNIKAGNLLTFTINDELAVFGSSEAIHALNGSTTVLEAGNKNILSGAIYASDIGTSVELKGIDGEIANNEIYSAAAIANAGGLTDTKVISALYAENGAKINVTGNNTILSYADVDKPEDLERVVWAYKTADIAIDGTTVISTDTYDKSANSNDIAIAAGTATGLNKPTVEAPVPDRATVSVKYDATSQITGDILSAYQGLVDITPKSDTAQMHITGNILAGNNGVLNVNLGNGGTLTGRADDYGDAGVIDNSGHGTEFFDPAFSSDIFKGGEVNLTMGDNSRWNVTGQSWITRINTEGSSNAIIDLVSANTDRNAAAHALTVYEMNGDAIFNMSLDADRTVSDMVYMKNATGDYVVNVVDPVTQADMYASRNDGGIFDGLRFATVGKGSKASFRAITWDQGVNNIEYEVGTDSYDTSDENHHYDSSTGNGAGDTEKPGTDLVEGFFGSEGTPGAQEAPANGIMMMAARADEGMGTNTDANGTEVDETTNFKLIGVKSSEISDAGKTVIAMSRINYSNAVYMDRLNKRMGEARYIDGDEGLWVRMRHDRIGKSDAFRSMNTMMELGYDTRVNDREDGEHRQGVAIDYMRGTADYKNVAGEGDVRRGGIWFYDTWLGNKGHYTDYVLKFGRLSNDFELYTRTLGEKVTGDYSNFVYSASAEYGRKKDLGNDWYIEPQAQIQYAHVTDADYTTSQGTNVQLDAIDSLIGRVGFRLGKDMGEKTTFYVKADILHEFLGDQDIEARDATGYLDTTYENEGTWYDVGLGFSHQFSKGTYMFLDMEKTFGNDNEDTYQFNFGMNWKV